jgi:hypothetical protein
LLEINQKDKKNDEEIFFQMQVYSTVNEITIYKAILSHVVGFQRESETKTN